MYLKSLYIQGFKSFADKTKIEFNKKITGVVGPNGSGKSNISDAIMWVLGETSVKTLRGKKMEDVIFSGTNKRKPLGFAEVTIVFNNEDRALNIDFNEVSVTRKMYRSLESEYLINSSKVRLKDIKELFMDTGIGKDGYSLIGQGKIESILSTKPQDRRAIFEEASGISKYKSKKLEAENKLKRTEDNIIRLSDIISEIASQEENLKIESEKAKLYNYYFEKLKILDLNISKRDLKRLLNYLEGKKNDIKNYEKQTKSFRESLGKSLVKENEFKNQIQKINEIIEEKNSTNLENTRQVESLTGNIKLLKERNRALNNSILNANNNIDEIKSENSQYEQSINLSKEIIDKEIIKFKELNNRIQDIDKNINDLEKKYSISNESEKSLEENRINLLTEITSITRDIDNLGMLIDEKNLRIDGLKGNIDKLETNIKEILNSLDDYKEKLSSNKSLFKKLEEEKNKNEGNFNNINLNLDAISKKSNELKNEYESDILKKKTLINIIENFDGYSKSVKQFMNFTKKRNLFSNSLIGPVGENLSLKKEYEIAISVALGGNIQNIIVKDEKSVKNMIDLLNEESLGRVTFMPIDRIKSYSNNFDLSPFKNSGILGFADQLITTKKDLQEIFKFLLGKIVIAKDYKSALNFSNEVNKSYRVVTLNGESLNIGGSITGGSSKNNSSLLFRTNELKRINLKIENLINEIKEGEINIKDLSDSASKLSIKISKAEEDLQEISNNNQKYENTILNLKNIYENTKYNCERYEQEFNELSDSIKNDKDKIESLKKVKEVKNKELNEINEDLKDYRSSQDSHNSEINKIKDLKANLSIEVNEINLNIKINKEKIINFEDLIKSGELKLNSLNENIFTYNESICENENKIKDLNLELASSSKKTNCDVKELQKAKEDLKVLEIQLNDLKNSNDIVKENIFENEKKLIGINNDIERAKNEYEDICLRVKENYEVDIKDFGEVQIDSVQKAREDIKDLKIKIKDLGNVNLSAIEEYEDVSKRLEFNIKQRDDLLDSKKELKKIISQLEESMSKIFKNSFTLITKNFDDIFKILFKGGHAELIIEDEEDSLNSGIEIKAQPPGKRFQSLSLLSGGERALTAVALLFALLKVRPAPFCILDEIDAALDDSNIKRYCEYLMTLDDIQFILITHRKISMQICDILYGVTMEELGVSKIISTALKG